MRVICARDKYGTNIHDIYFIILVHYYGTTCTTSTITDPVTVYVCRNSTGSICLVTDYTAVCETIITIVTIMSCFIFVTYLKKKLFLRDLTTVHESKTGSEAPS